MSPGLHPTALIDREARLGVGVSVGPFAIIGPGVIVGDHCEVAARAILERNTILGPGCRIGIGTVIGGDPQDRKYAGEETWVEIGEGTRVRDYSTVNRGTAFAGRTVIGRRCYLMSYVHVAHDCVIEDEVTIANAVQLAGHVHVEEHASLGGSTPVHQFVRIGAFAFVGGGSRVPQDIPPFARAAGNPLRLYGTNSLGLTRAGFPPQTRLALKHAFRLLFNSDLTVTAAVERLRGESDTPPEVLRLVDFVSRSERGILV